MSRSRRIFAGFGLGLFNQALLAIGGLFVTRYVLHKVGSRDYGLWIVGGQFLAYLSLLDLGVTALLPRDIATVTGKPIEPDERDRQVRELLARAMSIVLILVPVLAVACAVTLGLLPADWAELHWPLAISLAIFVVTYPLHVADAVLTGLQEFTFLGWVQLASGMVSLALTAFLASAEFGLYALALGPAVARLLSSSASLARLLSAHRRLIPRRLSGLRSTREHGKLGRNLWVSLSQIAHVLLSGTDTVVIGRMMGPEAVIPYAFTDKLRGLLNSQPYRLVDLAGPALSEVRSSGDRPRMLRAIGALSAVVLTASGGITVGILATNHAFVRAWVGERYWGSTQLTMLLLANMILRHGTYTFLVALFYLGRERTCTIMGVADGLLSLALTIILVHRLGLVGAPLAALVSAATVQTPAAIILLAREIGIPVRGLMRDLFPWLIRFALLAPAAALVGNWLGVGTVGAVVLAGLLAGAAYAAAMLPILLRPPLDEYARPYLAKLRLTRLP